MRPSMTTGDVRQVLYESAPKHGKRKLQVVFQRKGGKEAVTLEKGTNAGNPWLAVPIKHVAALMRALVQAYQILFEFQRNDDLGELPFPIQLVILRRRIGPSLSIVNELRVCVDERNDRHYVDLTVFQQDGEAWAPTFQRIMLGFADLEPVVAALCQALRMTHGASRAPRSSSSSGSRLDESPQPYSKREGLLCRQ